MAKDHYSKSGVNKWLKHFKAGTILNEVHTNSKRSVRFFGALPAMRGNLFELYMICFARQLLSLEDAELASKIEAIRKRMAVGHEGGSQLQENLFKSKQDLRQIRHNCLSGAFNPWAHACQGITNPEMSSLKCVRDLKSWAVELLKVKCSK